MRVSCIIEAAVAAADGRWQADTRKLLLKRLDPLILGRPTCTSRCNMAGRREDGRQIRAIKGPRLLSLGKKEMKAQKSVD